MLDAGLGTTALTFTFLGSEASSINSFWWNGVKLFQTSGNTSPGGLFNAAGFASTTVTNVTLGGLINFFFQSTSGTAANGSNPDDAGGLFDVGPNFFVSFDNGTSSTSGNSFVLWFDDNGDNNDDDHDDMAIRITLSNGTASIAALAPVPVPAAMPLLLVGLAGLGALRLRRKRSA